MATAAAEAVVRDVVRARLEGDGRSADSLAHLVLAALEGRTPLDALLDDGVLPEAAVAANAAAAALGAYITSVTVEGFRGVGPAATLELTPGPGLTLVIGRNGSGKSSFAEALEVLFTEDNQRWAKRSAVWREGWRNLHHADASIEATLAVEGHSGPTTVTRSWLPQADLTESQVEVRPHGGPATDLTFLGWKDAMATYRPFLSYNELGSMFDEGPTRLHDAVSSVLGLEELTDAEKALKDARLERERAVKAVDVEREDLVALLEGVGDDRASAAIVALRPRAPDFAALGGVLVAGDGSAGAEVELLRRVLAYDTPDEAAVSAAARRLAHRAPGRRRARRDAVGRAAARRGVARRRARVPRRLSRRLVPRLRDAGHRDCGVARGCAGAGRASATGRRCLATCARARDGGAAPRSAAHHRRPDRDPERPPAARCPVRARCLVALARARRRTRLGRARRRAGGARRPPCRCGRGPAGGRGRRAAEARGRLAPGRGRRRRLGLRGRAGLRACEGRPRLEGSRDVAQERGARDPQRTLRADRRRGDGDLGAAAPPEQRRARPHRARRVRASGAE